MDTDAPVSICMEILQSSTCKLRVVTYSLTALTLGPPPVNQMILHWCHLPPDEFVLTASGSAVSGCQVVLFQSSYKLWPSDPFCHKFDKFCLYICTLQLCVLVLHSKKQQITFGFLVCLPLIWLTGSCLLTVCDPAVSRSCLGALISLKFFLHSLGYFQGPSVR